MYIIIFFTVEISVFLCLSTVFMEPIVSFSLFIEQTQLKARSWRKIFKFVRGLEVAYKIKTKKTAQKIRRERKHARTYFGSMLNIPRFRRRRRNDTQGSSQVIVNLPTCRLDLPLTWLGRSQVKLRDWQLKLKHLARHRGDPMLVGDLTKKIKYFLHNYVKFSPQSQRNAVTFFRVLELYSSFYQVFDEKYQKV